MDKNPKEILETVHAMANSKMATKQDIDNYIDSTGIFEGDD